MLNQTVSSSERFIERSVNRYMSAELLLRLCDYQNHREHDIAWFCAAVRCLSPAELPMLLRFITGIARLDDGGRLPPVRGRQHRTIEVWQMVACCRHCARHFW